MDKSLSEIVLEACMENYKNIFLVDKEQIEVFLDLVQKLFGFDDEFWKNNILECCFSIIVQSPLSFERIYKALVQLNDLKEDVEGRGDVFDLPNVYGFLHSLRNISLEGGLSG